MKVALAWIGLVALFSLVGFGLVLVGAFSRANRDGGEGDRAFIATVDAQLTASAGVVATGTAQLAESQAELRYLNEFCSNVRYILEALSQVNEDATISEHEAAFARMAIASARLRALDPPARYSDAHRELLRQLVVQDESIKLAREGLAELNPSKLEAARQLVADFSLDSFLQEIARASGLPSFACP